MKILCFHERPAMALVAGLTLAISAGGAEPGVSSPEYFRGGAVGIISSSHQDTAWMDTPEFCRNYRVEQCITPALEMMAKNPRYCFAMECTLHLMEFLEAHPERRDEVARLTREGRLEWGATYNQPYESWLSGEELVRQVYYGRRWIQKNLPGCDTRVAFNPDVPGRALQMQQILAKAGVPYMFTSRYHEGVYRWQSPDDSEVLVYTPAHYGNPRKLLEGTPEASVRAIAAKLTEQAGYYQKHHLRPSYCIVNSDDFQKPKDFGPIIGAWNTMVEPANGRPTLDYMSFNQFFSSMAKDQSGMDVLMGERPDVWLYIQGPTHHWTSSARREAARLLPAAETFTSAACLIEGSFSGYPTKEFDSAWMDEIYMDHGIGGKNGDITDRVFHQKIEHARDFARNLLDRSLNRIATEIKTEPDKGLPITVFNTLSWARTDSVEFQLPESFEGSVRVMDSDGNEALCQTSTLGMTEEINVASAAQGARAFASSSADKSTAEKAIDDKWAAREDKWASAAGAGPHWLTVDFGQPRTIHRVVIRHEGALGVFREETLFNTTDFRLQGSMSAEGPWIDLGAPITNNTVALTAHSFAPQTMRFLRVYITKGTPDGGDHAARILEVQAYAKAPVKGRKLLFLAKDVPALGYKTFYLSHGVASSKQMPIASDDACEDAHYRLTLAPGGIRSIRDKEQNRELLETTKFLGGEVFTMLSVSPTNRDMGTDAGEFGAVPMPVMDESFDRVSNHRPRWTLVENGPVRTVYRFEQPWKDTLVSQRVTVWHPIKRIDCDVELADFNGRLWREFRLALPVAMEKPTLAYEVPMGVVEIGKDEIPTTGGLAYGKLDYFEQCRDIHPREVQNFVDASDSRGGMTLSTSVSVFDYVDPTTNAVSYPVIQPVLLASRRSCNGEGNWYPQAGNHHYRFSLSSHPGGWRNGWQSGVQANHPLEVVVGARTRANASMLPSQSLFSANMQNVVISTVKKAEDDDNVVVRCYDMEGKDTQVALKFFKPVQKAQQTDIIEENGKPLPIDNGGASVKIGHHAIETVKVTVPVSRRN